MFGYSCLYLYIIEDHKLNIINIIGKKYNKNIIGIEYNKNLNKKKMTNITRTNFHLVSPSPWPLFTCFTLLALTTSLVSTMHGFTLSQNNLYLALFTLIFSMSLWFRDVISEATYQGNHTLAVQRGLNMGVALFIVSEALFFLAIFWTFFHSAFLQLTNSKESSRYPWLTPQLYSDILRALLDRVYDSLKSGLKSPPRPHSFSSLPLQSNYLLKLKLIFINIIRILTLTYRTLPNIFTRTNIVLFFNSIVKIFTLKNIVLLKNKMWENRYIISTIIFISIIYRHIPYHYVLKYCVTCDVLYPILFSLVFAVLRLLKNCWNNFYPFSFKTFLLDMLKGFILFKLIPGILFGIIILFEIFPSLCYFLLKDIYYYLFIDLKYKAIYRNIDFDMKVASPIEQSDRKIVPKPQVPGPQSSLDPYKVKPAPTGETAVTSSSSITAENPLSSANLTDYTDYKDFVNSVTGKENYARNPSEGCDSERINERYVGRNSGFFGGTINTLDNWMTSAIRATMDGSLGMLKPNSPFWAQMRSHYHMPDNADLETHLPRISHVPIRGDRPHETGILVHLLRGNVHYSTLSDDEINVAREHMRKLLFTYADNLTSLRKDHNLESDEPDLAALAQATHEYRAIVHHYQLYFSNRRSWDFANLPH